MNYGFQIHGYKSGHQCLYSTVQLNRADQDAIDRLSDISGPLKPAEIFAPYLTCYPLPSSTYFVLARTWQDLNAPRAGCVITKSLLVSMDLWRDTNATSSLFAILLSATSDRNELLNDVIGHDLVQDFLSANVNVAVNELVEAIFVEKRQPIVYFNVAETDAIIYRLYSVYWNNLKSTFAACSFALSQRSIDGKPFDLLFAPLSAKPRFSEWPGRRIDGQNTSPRHRWTPALVSSIFNSHRPHLLDDDEDLPISPNNPEFNENDFRLNLAWKELFTSAKTTTPYLPVLGMLDIVNSLKSDSSATRKIINPLIRSAIDTAMNQLNPMETWNFLASVLFRYKRKLMDREMFESIRAISSNLAQKDPQSALEFLSSYKRPIESIPALLFSGMGDGMCWFFQKNPYQLPFDLLYNSEFISPHLIAASEQFTELLVEKVNTEIVEWELVLDSALQIESSSVKSKIEKNLSTCIHENTRSITVEKLLDHCENKDYEFVVETILRNLRFNAGAFTEVIYYNAVRLDEEEYLFRLLQKNDRFGYSDQLLALCVYSKPALLKDLLHESQIGGQRMGAILSYLLERPDEKTIDLLNENEWFGHEIIAAPYKSFVSQNALVTLLFYGNLPVDIIIREIESFDEDAFKRIPKRQFDNLIRTLLNRDSLKLTKPIVNVLKRTDTFDYKLLFYRTTEGSIPADQLLSNINLLFGISDRFNRFLSENVNVVSRLLANNLNDKTINNNLASRWIKFFHESAKYKKPYKEAAVAMLEFSFKCNSFDPTELIAASFPIVYKSFLKGKPITSFLPMISFPDWDKCRTLREDLVKLYLHKSWSKAGLFYIAGTTDILKETVHILSDKKTGKKFLEDAINEAKKIPNQAALLTKIFQEL